MEKEKMKIENPELLKEQIDSENISLNLISIKHRDEIFKEFTSEITTFMYPAPAKDVSETEKFIVDSMKANQGGINFQTVILDKKTKEFLGCAGLHKINTKTPELGIWLKKTAHGHGYGREAIVALKEWADKNIDYEYILYPVVDENYASRMIPESLEGKIAREYDEMNMSGVKLHLVEYRIYPNKKI